MVVRCTFVVTAVIAAILVPVYADRIALEAHVGSRPSEAEVMSINDATVARTRAFHGGRARLAA